MASRPPQCCSFCGLDYRANADDDKNLFLEGFQTTEHGHLAMICQDCVRVCNEIIARHTRERKEKKRE